MPALLLKILTSRITQGALAVLVLLGILYGIYAYGNHQGKHEVTVKWDDSVKDQDLAQTKLQLEFSKREAIDAQNIQRISDALAKSETAHSADIAALQRDYAERMRVSDQRAEIYQRLSKASPADQAYLAGHAAELDRALEQGINLVEEFSLTVGQREDQIKLLGEQLVSDRQVVNGTDNAEPGNSSAHN